MALLTVLQHKLKGIELWKIGCNVVVGCRRIDNSIGVLVATVNNDGK